MTPNDPRAEIPLRGALMLVSLGLFWGLNWPVMKIVLGEMTIWWFRALSVAAGGAGMLAIAAVTRSRLMPTRAEIGPLLLCALFAIIGWHVCTGYGVSLMPAGRASIIAFTMPVWAAILSIWLLGERMTGYKLAGLALGLGGLGVLIGPDMVAIGAAPTGAIFMLGAAMTWAIGTVLFKRFRWDLPVISALGWQLALGTLVIGTVAAVREPVPDLTALSRDALIGLGYLIVFPMIYCHWAYYSVVRLVPAGVAALGTLAVPVVGVLSSALILGEPVGPREVVAMALIVSALAVVLVLPAMLRPGRER